MRGLHKLILSTSEMTLAAKQTFFFSAGCSLDFEIQSINEKLQPWFKSPSPGFKIESLNWRPNL